MIGVRGFPADLPPASVPVGTKGRILTAALVAFSEHGFAGASIRLIAAGAGINSATLYSHFPSKETILAELISIGSHELAKRIAAALADAVSPEERLDAIIGATVRAHAGYPLLAIVTNTEVVALGPDLARPATAPTVESAGLLRQILTDGITAQVFDVPDPDTTAHILEGMAQQIPQWIDPHNNDPDHLVHEYTRAARRIVWTWRGTTGAA